MITFFKGNQQTVQSHYWPARGEAGERVHGQNRGLQRQPVLSVLRLPISTTGIKDKVKLVT